VLDELYSIPEICRALKISPRKCHGLIRSGVLPTIRVGRTHRISKPALDAWVAAGGTRATPNRTDVAAGAPQLATQGAA